MMKKKPWRIIKMCEKNNGGNSFVIGALLGAAAGAVLGVLMAPEKGTETVKKIKAMKNKYAAEGQLNLERIEGIANEAIDEIKVRTEPTVKELKEKVEKVGGPLKEEIMEKINQLVDEVSTTLESSETTITEKKQTGKKRTFSGIK